jgi:hypothetical protein
VNNDTFAKRRECFRATPMEKLAEMQDASRQGLKDTGYVEGENVIIVYRWASSTAGPRISLIDCRSWRPNSFTDGLP